MAKQNMGTASDSRVVVLPTAGQYSFSVVPYGNLYFVSVNSPPIYGTQVALPNIAGVTDNNFTLLDDASGAYASPDVEPLADTHTRMDLLIQDTQVGEWQLLLAPRASVGCSTAMAA